MCSWDVIWRNLYKCGRKRSKVHLSRLSPFHFRSPAFWFFFGSQIVPNLQGFLTILLASMFEITGFHRIRSYDVTSFTSFLLLGDFGALGTLGVSTSWSPNIRKQKSLPSASILFFPKKENESPKTKMWGLCRRTIYLYKYIIIDVSLSSKSSVISTSSRNVLDWGPSTAAPLVLPSSSHLRFGFHAYPNLGTVGRVRWLPEKNMQRPAVCNGSMTCKII